MLLPFLNPNPTNPLEIEYAQTVTRKMGDVAKMALDDPLLSLTLDGVAQIGADVRLGHEAVQHIDPRPTAGVHHGEDLGLALSLQPLAAQSDLADLQSCISKGSVSHDDYLVALCSGFFGGVGTSPKCKMQNAKLGTEDGTIIL